MNERQIKMSFLFYHHENLLIFKLMKMIRIKSMKNKFDVSLNLLTSVELVLLFCSSFQSHSHSIGFDSIQFQFDSFRFSFHSLPLFRYYYLFRLIGKRFLFSSILRSFLYKRACIHWHFNGKNMLYIYSYG